MEGQMCLHPLGPKCGVKHLPCIVLSPYISEIQQHHLRLLKQVCIWQTNDFANIFHPNSRREKCLFLCIFSQNISKIIKNTPVVMVFPSKQLKRCSFPNLNQFWNLATIDQKQLWKIQLFKTMMDDVKIFWCFWNCTRSLYMSTDSLGHPLQEFRLDWDSLLPLTLPSFLFLAQMWWSVSYKCGGRLVCVLWSCFLDWRSC